MEVARKGNPEGGQNDQLPRGSDLGVRIREGKRVEESLLELAEHGLDDDARGFLLGKPVGVGEEIACEVPGVRVPALDMVGVPEFFEEGVHGAEAFRCQKLGGFFEGQTFGDGDGEKLHTPVLEFQDDVVKGHRAAEAVGSRLEFLVGNPQIVTGRIAHHHRISQGIRAILVDYIQRVYSVAQ